MPVAIAGMHRSGASMVARALNLAGLDLGPEEQLSPPPPDSPAGGWAHAEFTRLNEEILEELGGDWAWPPPPNGSLAKLRRRPVWPRAKRLAESFDGSDLWGWKDPLSSLTLPFWSELLDELKVVVCLRNPLEVAVSLESREGCSRRLGLELWRAYNERIVAATTPEQRLVTNYDDYFAHPSIEARRLLRFVGLPDTRAAVRQACSSVDPSLRHARFTFEHFAGGKVPQDVVDLYAQLLAEAGSDEPRKNGAYSEGEGSQGPALRSGRSRRAKTLEPGDEPVPEIGGSPATSHARRAALRARVAALRTKLQERPEIAPDLYDEGRSDAYRELIGRLREVVDSVLPLDAQIAAVSRGDEELLRLGYRPACHFPQTSTGTYAGSYPEDSAAAIQALQQLRERGVEYLLFPSPAFWWLDHYAEFRAHLEHSFPVVVQRDETCRVYALSEAASARVRAPSVEQVPLELDEPELRLELASLLMRLGEAEEAADVLSEGLALDPRQPRLHAAMILCAEALDDPLRAGRHAAEGRELAGDDVTANRELAAAAWDVGRLSFAEERLAHLLTVHPTERLPANNFVYLLCARVLKTPGNQGVNRLVSEVARLDGLDILAPDTLFHASEILEKFDRPREALECLAAVLRQTSLEDQLLRTLATLLLRPTGLPVPEDDPRALAAVLTLAGNTFTAVHDERRAELCWRLARVLAREQAAAAFNLSWLAIDAGRPAEAYEQLSALHLVDPGEAGMICWPSVAERPWPHAPLRETDGWESLKPEGKPWPRITVVTRSLNQAPYAEETILSVLNQGYPDLEYIVVDSGSTDGSQELLRGYEPRFARLVVEPDEGRANGINKGLRLATGDLVTWLDAGDMLAPGALFALAATQLFSGADVVASPGLEHTDRHFGYVDIPAAGQEAFNVSSLGDLFENWLGARDFAQPRLAFTRRLLEEAGGTLREEIDDSTVDYELWLRFAAAGGELAVAPLAVTFFRKHPERKSTAADALVIELAKVRDTFVVPRPTLRRTLDVRRKLGQALSRSTPRIRVVSPRAAKIFSPDTPRELEETFATEGLEVSFHDEIDLDLAHESDLVVLLLQLVEYEALRELRQAGAGVPTIGWTWDNHHDVRRNYRQAADVDVLIPGHAFASEYLHSTRYLTTEPLPLCTTQWTVAEAKALFGDTKKGRRSDALYGGFVRYGFADKRNRLVEELQQAGVEGVAFIEEDAMETYFDLSPEERFAQWAGHKTSLCLPLDGDLSQRFFDALLTGQIPLVPPDLHDLDSVVPRDLQELLPVVRFTDYTAAAVEEAHAGALRLFDRDGHAGILRRHRYALANGMFASRISAIVAAARTLAQGSV